MFNFPKFNEIFTPAKIYVMERIVNGTTQRIKAGYDAAKELQTNDGWAIVDRLPGMRIEWQNTVYYLELAHDDVDVVRAKFDPMESSE